MLNGNDKRFVDGLAKAHSLPIDYLLDGWVRDGAVRDGRLVKLQLLGFPGSALDVSQLAALESIRISGEFRQLELGKLSRLQLLDLSDSRLERLEISGCPALTSLKVARTPLAALPTLPSTLELLDCDSVRLGVFAPRLPKLRSLAVGSCNLSRLDLSGAPALTTLQAEFNQLEALDLGALSELVTCWCQGNGARLTLPKMAPLQRLSIGANRLEGFDPGRFPELQMLLVSELGLQWLPLQNPKLNHLDCSKNSLTSLDLREAPSLRRLTAEGNRFDALDLTPLHQLGELRLESSVDVLCTELQKHTLPSLRERFGLPKPKTLSKMDVFQLHAYVQSYNWDDGKKRLFEVIRHPECSLATALLVYWQSQPDELSQYAKPKDAPRDLQKAVELAREIEQGVKAERFAASPIPFDATNVNGVDLFCADPLIPAVMRSAAAVSRVAAKPKAPARKTSKPARQAKKSPKKPRRR